MVEFRQKLGEIGNSVKGMVSDGWERSKEGATNNPTRTWGMAIAGIVLGMYGMGMKNGTGGMLVGGAVLGAIMITIDAMFGEPLEGAVRGLFKGGKSKEVTQGQSQGPAVALKKSPGLVGTTANLPENLNLNLDGVVSGISSSSNASQGEAQTSSVLPGVNDASEQPVRVK